MKVSTLSVEEIAHRLKRQGLVLRIGPFVLHLQSPIALLANDVARLYADFEIEPETRFADFHVRIAPPPNYRRWLRPQVQFVFDGEIPFKPLPLNQAFAFFEWGLNWCIHAHVHQDLIVHAAVVERGGRVAVMPGEPRAGKSTLCAGLINRGWRLFSDELALISTGAGTVAPLARPVSLKDESIDLIGEFAPDAVFGTRVSETNKGSVAHLRPPADSVARSREPASPGWLIFPRYVADARAELAPLSRGRAFIRAAEDAFNYSLLGTTGFETMAKFVAASDCYEFTYGDLQEATEVFSALEPPGIAVA